MERVSAAIYLCLMGVKDFASQEIGRIKRDERGMELVQVVIILLIVILIAVAVWAFLGEWITQLLDTVYQQQLNIDESGITNPFGQ